jgi:membrane-bound lytic murein transglycosylase B
MSATRFGRLHKATALVPLALLSAAWTASLAGVNAPLAAAGERQDPTLPDGTSVPAQAIEAPASVSDGSLLAPGVGNADAAQIVSTASTSGIPSAALAAYQRAETVINAADESCHLSWQLIAAIGRVESNHGRVDGNVLDDNGLATPGIFGVALNGANSTTEIVDTDAGQFDNDAAYDRAVGPMQFIPSTWSVVGVDADGDGVRNPQDVDDAALGTAVYLCSGSDDLGTDQGRQAAVFRYNHSQSYVDLVLAIMDAYLQGDFTSIPNGTVMAGELTKAPPPLHVPGTPATPSPAEIKPPATHTTDQTPVTPEPTQPPAGGNSGGGNTGGGGNSGGGNGGGGHGGGGGGVNVPGTPVTIPPLPTTSVPPVDQVLTLAQATVQCTLDGLDQLLQPTAFQQCLDNYMNPRTAADRALALDAKARLEKDNIF